MKVYVLCSYNGNLSDPFVSTDYEKVYQKMAENYHDCLDGQPQTEDEAENTYLSEYSACAVVNREWLEWSITEFKLPIPKLSSEKPHHESEEDWIPISERLPDKSMNIWVTIPISGTRTLTKEVYYVKQQNKFFYPSRYEFTDKIIAWKPKVFPAPYNP